MKLRDLRKIAAVVCLAYLAASAALAQPGSGSVVFVRSSAGDPWGNNTDEVILTDVFGSSWQTSYFETVNPSVLFSPNTSFIFMDGSDMGANAMSSFLNNNMSAMQAWVLDGGSLFLNAAPNEGGNINFGFGVTLVYNAVTFTATGEAVNDSAPIFTGPFVPVGNTWTGNWFAHATVKGAGLNPLIRDTADNLTVLGEESVGSGYVMFGGMTLPSFHSPQPQGNNLLANILSYAAAQANLGSTPVATTNAWDGTNSISGFGEPNTGTFGQTFMVPLQTPVLTRFTLFISNVTDSVSFQFCIMPWNGSEATGPILYQSAETNTTGASGWQSYTFRPRFLPLLPGSNYVAFITASGPAGQAAVGSPAGYPYTNGNFVYNNNGTNFSLLTNTTWTAPNPTSDLAFAAIFGGSPASLEPFIVTNPQSLSLPLGSNATLNVAATSIVPFDYQWYFDGSPLQDQTNTTLLVSASAFTDSGSYDVVVSNHYGAVTSEVAYVQVIVPSLVSFGSGEGQNPYSSLVQARDGSLYGTTDFGGTYGLGTIFRLSANGAISTLYSFSGGADGGNSSVNQSQTGPSAALIQGSDGNFYGTTEYGGAFGYGTVFRMSADGSLITLYSFTGGCDGGNSTAGLIQASDGNLYGTTSGGDFYGTVFRITTNGAFTLLYAFTGADDGAEPEAPLIQASDGYLYGTASAGGVNGEGTVFRVDSDGAFNTLFSFNGTDGSTPEGALLQAPDGYLYGTTSTGSGHTYGGTVFRISTNGAFNTVYLFPSVSYYNYWRGGYYYEGTNGVTPSCSLVQAHDGALYGTTSGGGLDAEGTVFRISTNGIFTSLYQFTGANDGATPYAGLVLAANGSLYGTASSGGNVGYGTIFQIDANDSFAPIHSFIGNTQPDPVGSLLIVGGNLYGMTLFGDGDGTVFQISTNAGLTTLYAFTGGSDGNHPDSGLIEASDGYLYGTTTSGGEFGDGTVFQISTNGALTSLYSFTGGNDGSYPNASLVQANDGFLYGTTGNGGTHSQGTVFQISTKGVLTTLRSFNTTDGANPEAALIEASDGFLYGTTANGGGFGDGTVFRISTNGGFALLHAFNSATGAYPEAALVQATSGILYGTTSGGGAKAFGTVFKMSTGGAFSLLYSFTGGNDGRNPDSSLIQAGDGNLYGTTPSGGVSGFGTVFEIKTNGAFTSLYSFTGSTDGGDPGGGLVWSGGYLYGVAQVGGANSNGAVFQIFIPPSPAQPVTIGLPMLSTGNLMIGFPTIANQTYTVEINTDPANTNWVPYTKFTGNGLPCQLAIPTTTLPAGFFRIAGP